MNTGFPETLAFTEIQSIGRLSTLKKKKRGLPFQRMYAGELS